MQVFLLGTGTTKYIQNVRKGILKCMVFGDKKVGGLVQIIDGTIKTWIFHKSLTVLLIRVARVRQRQDVGQLEIASSVQRVLEIFNSGHVGCLGRQTGVSGKVDVDVAVFQVVLEPVDELHDLLLLSILVLHHSFWSPSQFVQHLAMQGQRIPGQWLVGYVTCHVG